MSTARILILAAALATHLHAQTVAEPLRPQFHFTPRVNWTNDPNGLVFFEGEYHLFFQYNPFGDTWGHMSWGHAVSSDLLRWQELPIALAEENGVMIFTGSTVVDERNTSGFCFDGKPCLVAIYTGHTPKTATTKGLQTQNAAYSNDRGRTWTKYDRNPVIDLGLPDFRDPHVFWSKASQRWVMAVALPQEHKVLFYGSPDLKSWERLSSFGPAGATGGEWECPTLAELPVDGDPRKTRFVLKIGLNPGALQGGSGEQYFVGSFDGKSFRNANPPSTTLWVDSGKDCYCALVFNHAPSPTMLGWMSNWQYAGKTPTSPWRGQMTAARRIGLKSTPNGLRLSQLAVSPFANTTWKWRGDDYDKLNAELRGRGSSTFELRATIAAGEFAWKLLSGGGAHTMVGYANGELYVDRTESGATAFSKDFPARTAVKLAPVSGEVKLRILVDRSSVEVFTQDGLVAITNLVFPPEGATGLAFVGNPKHAAIELLTSPSLPLR